MCCGKKRAQLRPRVANPATVVPDTIVHNSVSPPNLANSSKRQSSPPPQVAAAGAPLATSRVAQTTVSFAYVGNSAMTVVGPVTGYQYKFDRPGARLYVDPRDRAALASIRYLKQVR